MCVERVHSVCIKHMALPRKIKRTARLNLMTTDKAKREAFELAYGRDISVGKLFEELVAEEKARLNRIAGNTNLVRGRSQE